MGIGRRAYDATWGRAFARIYDRALAESEEAGMRERRRPARSACGRTVELGSGTGLNFAHYPEAVGELILTELFPPMAKRLRNARDECDRDRGARRPAAPSRRLADTVVSTLVLCTVDDVPATLAEIARVLRPGGRLLFAEHVRSDDPKLARWQDRLEGPWKFVGHGCRCNRDTLAALAASPLEVETVEHETIPKAAPIVRPLIVGSAHRPA